MTPSWSFGGDPFEGVRGRWRRDFARAVKVTTHAAVVCGPTLGGLPAHYSCRRRARILDEGGGPMDDAPPLRCAAAALCLAPPALHRRPSGNFSCFVPQFPFCPCPKILAEECNGCSRDGLDDMVLAMGVRFVVGVAVGGERCMSWKPCEWLVAGGGGGGGVWPPSVVSCFGEVVAPVAASPASPPTVVQSCLPNSLCRQ